MTFKDVMEYAGATDLRTLNDTVQDPYAMSLLINQVLIDLHSRFVLNQAIITIPIEKDKSLYNINDYIKD